MYNSSSAILQIQVIDSADGFVGFSTSVLFDFITPGKNGFNAEAHFVIEFVEIGRPSTGILRRSLY